MGVTKETVEATLTQKLQPTYLKVIDTSGGCGASFDVEIATAAFAGKRMLERHRVVNTALAEEIKDIHALSIRKALTPEQWEEQNAKPAASKRIRGFRMIALAMAILCI
ncbi:hypothetical protein R1sor_009802 [Riccia sorocarpa]|uniref:BolA-like protein n=1 Tax=Riccia sorocarpa TaxID=122646 RepID=A0ABD3I088_9MARC